MRFLFHAFTTVVMVPALVNSQAVAPFDLTSFEMSNIPASVPVEVSCVFENEWTEDSHPIDYPSISAHWSPMILAAHSSEYEMWAPGELASRGVQSVAESGSSSGLRGELDDDAGESVLDYQTGNVIYLTETSTYSMDLLQMDKDHSLLSTISMIAPSSDWFTGMYNFNVTSNGKWYQSFKIATFPWDAGTGTGPGDSYTYKNKETLPRENIYQLTVNTVPDTNVFLNPSGESVEPVATWTCSVEATEPIPEESSIGEDWFRCNDETRDANGEKVDVSKCTTYDIAGFEGARNYCSGLGGIPLRSIQFDKGTDWVTCCFGEEKVLLYKLICDPASGCENCSKQSSCTQNLQKSVMFRGLPLIIEGVYDTDFLTRWGCPIENFENYKTLELTSDTY